MAKSSRKAKSDRNQQVKERPSFALSKRTQDWIYQAVIVVILLFLLKPLVIDGLSPQGVDVVGSLGKMHQVLEYQKESGQRALWNPSIFAGMPTYHRISPVAFSMDNLLDMLGRLINPVFIYYLFAGIGFYWLARYLQMSPLVSLIGALLFIMMPHYKSLYLEGHFAKFKSLMYLPWIFLSMKYFLDKRSLLAISLFALAFGLQIRTQHYQIVFYTGMMVLALGAYPLIRDMIEKEYSRFLKSAAMLAGALVLAVAMSAQPLFLAKEYLPWSKRGKTTIDVNQQTASRAAASDGVSMDYATQWSTHPAEIFTWFVPRFYGGMSAEAYDGTKFRQARGQLLSTYWGHMPFTQSYEYMGVLTLMLALLGMIMFRRQKMLLSMMIFAAFLILLSFGRHLQFFYSIFYNYVPFFNKFRAPMMSVTVTYFIFTIFGLYGLKYLSQLDREHFDWKKHKTLIYLLASFFILGVLFWLYAQMSSFIKPVGERYQGQSLDTIISIRKEYLVGDVVRYIILVLLAFGSIVGYLKKKINFFVFGLVIGILAIGDLMLIQKRVHKDYTNLERLERRYFRESATDKFIRADNDVFRIFPTGQLFGDNRWAYFHETIGGYTPIKMFTIEELVEKNIYNGWDKQLPLNWNVLKILNVKYVILQNPVTYPLLEAAFQDASQKLFTYRFTGFQQRGFFVGSYKKISDEYDRLRYINSREFKPDSVAILETDLPAAIGPPDSSTVRVTESTPNKTVFDVFTDKQSLFVMSQVYYPPGWHIFIDNKEAEQVYKTDHAIQSVVVPAGAHKIEMRFEPASYFQKIKISYASLGLLYVIILLSVGRFFMKKKKQQGA